MKTRSVDIAAYFHMNGVQPTKVEWDEQYEVRRFCFEDTPLTERLRYNFNENALVPVRGFVEARMHVKHLRFATDETDEPQRRRA